MIELQAFLFFFLLLAVAMAGYFAGRLSATRTVDIDDLNDLENRLVGKQDLTFEALVALELAPEERILPTPRDPMGQMGRREYVQTLARRYEAAAMARKVPHR